MRLSKISFATSSHADGTYIASNPEALVNCYPEFKQKGRTQGIIRSVLGESDFKDLAVLFQRQLADIDGTLYSASGGRLYSIASDGTETNLGAIDDDAETTISRALSAVTVCANGRYFVYDTDAGTISEPSTATARFDAFGSVGFMDQYTILTEQGGTQFLWSDLGDPTTLSALNFAAAEASTDAIIAQATSGSALWLFGEKTTEVWGNTGLDNENAFQRFGGGVIDVGILGRNLLCKHDAGVFFIGSDGVCYLTQGTGVTPVAAPMVETDIEAETPTHCYYYEDLGHKFCVIRFENRPAWVLDIATGLWHNRIGAGLNSAWDTLFMTYSYGAWRAGKLRGNIVEMARTNKDVSGPLIRTMTGTTLQVDRARFRVAEFETRGRFGDSELGRDAKVMLRVSGDDGRTFGFERTISIGDLGNYDARALFRALGQFRSFTPQISIAEPVDISMDTDAFVRVA